MNTRFVLILAICVAFYSCQEGDTRRLYEFVRAADLGVVSFKLVKEHSDNLRPGREVSMRAVALLDSGDEMDVSDQVVWRSLSPDIVELKGNGRFRALSVDGLAKALVEAEFSGLLASTQVWVSVAPLLNLELGFAKAGVKGRCEIDPDITFVSQCSAQVMCILGSYEGEEARREETLYADFNGTQDSIFYKGSIINSEIDIESGDVSEDLIASLDLVSSNVFNFYHKKDLEELSAMSSKVSVEMGSSVQLNVSGISESLMPHIIWSFESWSLGQPEVTGSFSGMNFLADYENGFVSNFLEYGVDISVMCSGKSAEAGELLIESDVNQLKIIDVIDLHEIVIGDTEPTIFTLEALDTEGELVDIGDGEVSWFVCDLSNQCTESDRQVDEGDVLEFVSSSGEEEADLRIEAVFHGKKATREDFSLVLDSE